MKSCTLKFCEPGFANLIFLPVQINETVVTALFDTGAQKSFLSESTMLRLGALKNGNPEQAGNNQGNTFRFDTCTCKDIRIGAFSFSNVNIGILPDAFLDFGEDEHNNRFPGQMLLGWDIISQLCWEFDMCGRTVSLREGSSLQDGENLEWNGFPILSLFYKGTKITAGFDSGHTDTVLDRSWKGRVPHAALKQSLISGVGSQQMEDICVTDTFTIQICGHPVVLRDIEILEHTLYGAPDGTISVLLGADILTDAVWKLDPSGSRFSYARR